MSAQYTWQVEDMLKLGTIVPLLQRFIRAKSSPLVEHPTLPANSSFPPSAPPLWIQQFRPLLPPLPAVAQFIDIPGEVLSLKETVAQLLDIEDTVQADLLRCLEESELRDFIQADTYPLPATEDREGYYSDQHLRYWLSGLGDYLLLKQLLRERGIRIKPQFSLLDLGCASGRILRHFAIQETEAMLYGADINHINIKWIRQYLPQSIFCFQNTILPHLPLADNTLDLVYGCSVFTHIDDYEEGWLLEVKRVLKPQGLAFITIHSERTWNQINMDKEHFMYKYFLNTPHKIEDLNIRQITPDLFKSDMPANRVVLTHTGYSINNTNVFHTSGYIKERWGRLFRVLKIIPKAHGGHQDGALLLKE